MNTYQELYKERNQWKLELKRLQPQRERWREFVELSGKIRERTKLLKELCKDKTEIV